MSGRDYFIMVIVGGGAAYGMVHINRYQGCFGSSQSVELALDDSTPFNCNKADIHYAENEGSGTAIDVDCGDDSHRVLLYGATPSEPVCGYRFQVTKKWQGGPVEKWNVDIAISWEK